MMVHSLAGQTLCLVWGCGRKSSHTPKRKQEKSSGPTKFLFFAVLANYTIFATVEMAACVTTGAHEPPKAAKERSTSKDM